MYFQKNVLQGLYVEFSETFIAARKFVQGKQVWAVSSYLDKVVRFSGAEDDPILLISRDSGCQHMMVDQDKKKVKLKRSNIKKTDVIRNLNIECNTFKFSIVNTRYIKKKLRAL